MKTKIIISALLLSAPMAALAEQPKVDINSSTLNTYIDKASTEASENIQSLKEPVFKLPAPRVQKFSYREAKKALYNKVADTHTFYTNCKIWPGFKPRPNLSSCNLENDFSGKREERGSRIEAEHVVPASAMYKKGDSVRNCVLEAKDKGTRARKYCQKTDPDYKQAYTDLVNLVPTVGQVNADRSNKPFGMVRKIKYAYAKTQSYTGEKYFQPRPEVIGDIARIAFYMNWKYGVPFSNKEVKTFIKWNDMDPVSEAEKSRNLRVYQTQGWANPYVHPEMMTD